ncbi:Protein F41C3.5 [Aphelenchoides avenae]|nr:Protein F41C3.5 [Aphelenchus avenae]
MVLYSCQVAFLLLAAVAADTKDEIVDLPGLSFKPNFKHYSGYLKASETRFVESQGNPPTDPLVFWFNGGPGCSSLEGLLAEHGPYFLNNDTSTLRKNKYAWNKLANVVYIESPAGVGFSYCTEGDPHFWNDDTTSAESYRAIKHFLKKFPHFRNHRVFVTGESYAGKYVPTLAERIIDGLKDFSIRLEGIAIGNGLLNDEIDNKSLVEFYYGHGFIDEPELVPALDRCCETDIISCDLDGKCAQEYAQARPADAVYNPYDIYRHCYVPTLFYGLHKPDRKFPEKSSDLGLGLQPATCNPDFGPYLNKPEVRKALHIPGHVGTWQGCAGATINYICGHPDVSPQITKILDHEVRVLLYFGDTDWRCNFLGGQRFAASLGLKRLGGKQPWHFDDGFLAGFKTEYEKNLTYITVGGVGHMVPQWQPRGALNFFGQFLKNKPI